MARSRGGDVLDYFPVPAFAEGLCGLAYALRTGDEPVTLRLPALTAQVQVTLAGAVRHEGGRDVGADPAFAVLGPTGTAADATLAAHTRVIGLGLLPIGWIRTVGACAAELADTAVAADAIWGRAETARTMEEMLAAADARTAANLLFRFVAARPRAVRTLMDRRIALTTDWLGRAGTVDVSGLAATLDLSIRQTERFTARTFGARPKLLELKYRTLRLAAASAIARTPVYDVQGDGLVDSFYDQSHLIRNFRRFTGRSPRAFDQTADFARAMLQGRWNGGARSPTMLWS